MWNGAVEIPNLRTVLGVVLLLIFWQSPLYTWGHDNTKVDISASQRACFEVLGPALELGVTPPTLIGEVCEILVPRSLTREMVVEQSSVLALQQVVLTLHRAARDGDVSGLFFPPRSMWVVLAESASWIQLLPGLPLLAPCRNCAALWTLAALTALAARPCGLSELHWGFWVALTAASVDACAAMLSLSVESSSTHSASRLVSRVIWALMRPIVVALALADILVVVLLVAL